MAQVFPIQEGHFSVSSDKEFRVLTSSSPAGLKVAVQPFLIKFDEELILLDAGLGWQVNGELILHRELKYNGLPPTAITKIVLSHLHKDHVGGLGTWQAGVFKLNFPQASIYVQAREFDFAVQQHDNPAYDQEILEAFKHLPEIIWMNDDAGWITPDLCYQVTGGHSPFHQVFWITDGEHAIFYAGDNLPQQVYFQLDIAYKTDYDGKSAERDRLHWKQRVAKEGWTILFYHDLENPMMTYLSS